MQCPYCGAEIADESVVCPACRVSVEDGLPMNWYRFLTGMILWIAGIGTVLLGIMTMIGIPYLMQRIAPGTMYDAFPPLVVMDFVYGAVLIALGILCIVARFRLADFKRNAPRMVCVLYALIVLSSAVYSAASGFVVSGGKAPLVGLSEISSVLGMVAGVVLNAIYFRKRIHLFDR